MPKPHKAEPEVQKSPGQILDEVVTKFERGFEIVDDHYMHTGQNRTDEGEKFISVCIGKIQENGQIRLQPQSNHQEAADSWWTQAMGKIVSKGYYLAWRIRPVFEAVDGGFILNSEFVTQSGELSEKTTARLKKS